MANKLISLMDLPKSIANIFAARNIITAKDALSLTEYELMELLDVGLAAVITAMTLISEIACPPYQTVLSLLEQRMRNEYLAGHLPTRLKGLDAALCGDIPFGVVTELVGPAGVGKTQFCLKLALLASLPSTHGGLESRAIYIDTESKFSSRSFPEIFQIEGIAQQMVGRILVLQPTSLAEFTEREFERGQHRQSSLGWHISFIKIFPYSRGGDEPRSHGGDFFQYNFQVQSVHEYLEYPTTYDSHLVAALGISWAHAVSIRLILENKSGQRFLKLAKSSMSPPVAFPYTINASGMLLLDDNGTEISGSEINMIYSEGTDQHASRSMNALTRDHHQQV